MTLTNALLCPVGNSSFFNNVMNILLKFFFFEDYVYNVFRYKVGSINVIP